MMKGLIYESVLMNDHIVRALLDTEATHNFIFKEEAKCLGLKATQYGGTIKAVNSTPSHLQE